MWRGPANPPARDREWKSPLSLALVPLSGLPSEITATALIQTILVLWTPPAALLSYHTSSAPETRDTGLTTAAKGGSWMALDAPVGAAD